MTSATTWPFLAALSEREAALQAWARRQGAGTRGLYEFVRFGLKQAWACLFGAILLGMIVATHLWYPDDAPLARYDALVLASLVVQVVLLLTGMETWQEARVILVFHVVGTVMELFKTKVGSWHYPEASVLRIGGVPLFTGFMYAAIGSYLARVWRLFDFRFTRHPRLPVLLVLSAAIYGNFFLDHWGVDLRWWLLGAAVALFARTTIFFRVWTEHRRMPLVLGFFLVALFIWFAENIGTAGGAWLYPNQVRAWTLVSPAKLTSWSLLMLISYTLVAWTMRPADATERRAIRCLLAAGVVAVCGLVWRLVPMGLPAFWLNYGGSVLWGAMVLLLVAALERGEGRWWRTPAIAALIALCAELFRLYHTPALDAFRLTLPGALLFGHVFNPWNVAAYWVGIAGAVAGRAVAGRWGGLETSGNLGGQSS